KMTQAAETAVLDNVAATTPWLAPLLPASIAYHHLKDYLQFSTPMALVGAGVVELLGLSAVHTAFQLWQYNDEKRESESAAPFVPAALAGGVYLLVVITVNVILEAANTSPSTAAIASIVAKALLSTLSIVAAFVLALRAQHARRIEKQRRDSTIRSQAAELGRLRQAVERMKQEREELKQATQRVKQLETAAKQAETRAERLETAVKHAETERDRLVVLATQAKQLETAVKQADERANTAETTMKQLETAVKQAEERASRAETSAKQLETRWSSLPSTYQAAVLYRNGDGSMRQLAEAHGTSAATISRVAKAMFGENGQAN
ncbi:MAG: hypothetical protein IAE79_00795, partial [Anaerolinea sp.]|nr:hypothetical protein [Anaerolinea sp.]